MKIFEKLDEVSFAYVKFKYHKQWQEAFKNDFHKEYTEVEKEVFINWLRFNIKKLDGFGFEYCMYDSNMKEEMQYYQLSKFPYKIEYKDYSIPD